MSERRSLMRSALVAAGVGYSVDDKGILWLRAYDVTGMLICVCMLPAAGALQLADFIDEHYDVEDDEMGEVAGHA